MVYNIIIKGKQKTKNKKGDIKNEKKDTKSISSGGVGFFGALTILFIALKLIGVINWSWFYVLLPSIISLGLSAIILVIMLVVFIVVKIKNKEEEK